MRKIAGMMLVLLVLHSSTTAQISPGPLAKVHQSLEGIANCTKCHELGKAVADRLCLDCHLAIKSAIDSGRGYHASGDPRGQRCAKCHPDHNGRQFELIIYPRGERNFDHSLAGWKLRGRHAGLDCGACHKAVWVNQEKLSGDRTVNVQRTKLGLSAACAACHDDEHQGQLPQDCLKCHNETAWKPAPGFSHDSAGYPLTGRHRETACVKCHPLQPAALQNDRPLIADPNDPKRFAKFKGVPFANCTDCHKDVHKGKFGAACQDCHLTTDFKKIYQKSFDHNRTDYPLTGRHNDIDCVQCHKSGRMTDDLQFKVCRDCHLDRHESQFDYRPDKGECESCHSTLGFKPSLFGLQDHVDTRFPLTGSHLAVPCLECHQSAVGPQAPLTRFRVEDRQCRSCHTNPHGAEADRWMASGGCEVCHTTDEWSRTEFDHAQARFSLTGRHRTLECGKCHRAATPDGQLLLVLRPLALSCDGCHADPHAGQFLPSDGGRHCEVCHTPQDWRELTFNHNRDSRFKLEGAHARLSCSACHKYIVSSGNSGIIRYKPLPVECAGCHGAEALPDRSLDVKR